MKIKKSFLFIFSFLLICSFSKLVSASKIDTHVWIGQQIINDLEDDGEISFIIGNKVISIPVRPDITSAILSNKAFYLQGNIGPDASPGLYSGQMTIHPGSSSNGWGTGDWLGHLLSNAKSQDELAYVYGFLSHAAADILAHTYVNQYAGDEFSLLDGEERVERRHFLLEGYISEHLPPLTNFQGGPLGRASDLILENGQPAVPQDYLWRTLIQDSDAANQFGKNGSKHLQAIHNLDVTLGDLTEKGGPLDELHKLAQKLAALYVFDYAVSNEQLEKLNEAHQEFRDFTNDSWDDAQKLEKDIKNKVLGLIGKENQQVNNALKKAQELLKGLRELEDAKHQAEKAVMSELDKLNNINENVTREVCRRVKTGFDPLGDVIKETVCRNVNKVNPAYTSAKKLLELKQGLEKKASSKLTSSFSDFRGAIAEVLATSEQVIQAEIDFSQAAIDLLQRFHMDIDPISGIFKTWKKDINIATKAYFLANANSLKNSISNASAIAPLKEWAACWMPAIIGIPSEILNGICISRNAFKDILDALDKLEKLAIKQDPILNEVVKYKNEIIAKLKEALTEELYSLSEKATGVDVERLLNMIKEKPTAQMLNLEFSSAPNNKALLIISDVSSRVDAEMHLTNGVFDPIKYNAIYNAIVLSKLSLLDANGLNQLIGENIYTSSNIQTNNILVRFAHSIDGNHQWLNEAPPYLRSDENYTKGKQYGYSNGFPLWDNPKVKNEFFRQIFKGPINPALDIPESMGLSSIVPQSYPYTPSEDCAFPDFPGDNKCKYTAFDKLRSWLVSIF